MGDLPRHKTTIALAVTVRDGPQLANVRHEHLLAKFLQLFADPDRMSTRLHRNAGVRNIGKPLFDGLRYGSEAASVHNLTILVERAVMVPDIAKIDPDRHLERGMPAWNLI